ncbi:MAG: response regulator transcription factor [Clostridiaceae bacterium]
MMERNRILLVEDDKGVSDGLTTNLQIVGYETVLFDDGKEAAGYLSQDHSFDLALLDIMLPGIDGFGLCELMEQYEIPVIFLTAKTDAESEIKGLRGGAEDYIVKPFDTTALLVRIEKVLTRTGKLGKIYRVADVVLDMENRTVTKSGIAVDLTPLEFEVFALLLRNKNRTVLRERILNEIWGADYFGDPHTVEVRIANIRKKLDLAHELKTISKTGYRLEERVK